MKMNVVEMDIECPACGGTGLYVGMAERDGAAVVCYRCKGTGEYHYKYEYNTFNGRKKEESVKRVFKSSFGYVQSADDVTTKEGKKIKFSQGGVLYEDWLKGEEPKPVKEICCPFLWTYQETRVSFCDKNTSAGCMITKCPMQEQNHKCWAELEAMENAKDN